MQRRAGGPSGGARRGAAGPVSGASARPRAASDGARCGARRWARTLLDGREDGGHARGDDGLVRLEREQAVREPARLQLGPVGVVRRQRAARAGRRGRRGEVRADLLEERDEHDLLGGDGACRVGRAERARDARAGFGGRGQRGRGAAKPRRPLPPRRRGLVRFSLALWSVLWMSSCGPSCAMSESTTSRSADESAVANAFSTKLRAREGEAGGTRFWVWARAECGRGEAGEAQGKST